MTDCICEICGDATPGPMVHDNLWNENFVGWKFLCLTCMEHKLGRQITLSDLNSCGFNRLLRVFALRERYNRAA